MTQQPGFQDSDPTRSLWHAYTPEQFRATEGTWVAVHGKDIDPREIADAANSQKIVQIHLHDGASAIGIKKGWFFIDANCEAIVAPGLDMKVDDDGTAYDGEAPYSSDLTVNVYEGGVLKDANGVSLWPREESAASDMSEPGDVSESA